RSSALDMTPPSLHDALPISTNSIVQGDQPERLFRPIFEQGWRIKYAHRTFQWDSEAPGKAAVHCVIIGFTRDRESRPRLFDYERDRKSTRLNSSHVSISYAV